jgi:hypothetical protein
MPINSLLYPANSAVAGGFDVANSCRFNIGSSDHLTRSLGGSPTSTRKATWSYWVKRSTLTSSASEMIYSNEVANDNNRGFIQFEDNDSFRMTDSVSSTQLKTNRLFRDVSAFYHIVLAIDTTQGTAANRIKLYVNGVQETSFATASYPNQNDDLKILTGGQTNKQHISKVHGGSGYFGGYLSEFVFIDGLQLAPTDFGEFDEDSGIWKPVKVSGLTFGTNGFYLNFQTSAELGDDVSGNTNDFTENNLTAIDQTTDTCTNNFATLNPLFPEANIAYSEGNTRVTADGSTNWSTVIPTVALTNGKWYWEWKATSTSNCFTGIASETLVNSGVLISDTTPYDATGLILYFVTGRKTVDGSDTEGYFTAWGSGTMGAALDLDSGTRTIQMYHNGSATGSAVNLTANFAAGNLVFPVFMVNAGSYPSVQNPNFGNPNTANSSDAEDGNGYGNFEYAPPSGFLALCTKNLAEFG